MFKHIKIPSVFLSLVISLPAVQADEFVFEAGHDSLKEWLLPDHAPYPESNAPTKARVDLGKMLFFEPRLSRDGNMSCATCHNPSLGWSDGLPTARGFQSQILARATPTIINTAYNDIQMWDGRKKNLIDQASGPMEADVEMNSNIDEILDWLNKTPAYTKLPLTKLIPMKPSPWIRFQKQSQPLNILLSVTTHRLING